MQKDPERSSGTLGERLACDRYRYVVLFLGVVCLTAVGCNYSIINFTFICMTEDASDVIVDGNTTRQRYDYTPAENGQFPVAVGTITGMMPINWAYIRWGARYPFFLSGMLSALAIAFSPWAAGIHLWVLLALRFLQGIAYAADFAAIGVIVVRWAPLNQTAIFISFLTCFSPISAIITNPTAGAFCTSSLGWRWAFYTFSIFTAIFFILWVILYKDDPELHTSVSSNELAAIQAGKTPEHIKRDNFVPYKAIIKSKVILVVWFNALTELIGYIIMLTYAPIYINKVLGYSVTQTALLSTIGSCLHFPLKLVCGILSDRMTYIPERTKMYIFNTLAVGVAGILCGGIGLMPTPLLAVLSLTASTTIMGVNVGGFYKCGSLHSRQYSHFVLAMIQFSKSIALVIGPLMVAVFAHSDSDRSGWVVIFLLNTGLMLIANCLFYWTATDQPAEFTKITKESASAVKGRAVVPGDSMARDKIND